MKCKVSYKLEVQSCLVWLSDSCSWIAAIYEFFADRIPMNTLGLDVNRSAK